MRKIDLGQFIGAVIGAGVLSLAELAEWVEPHVSSGTAEKIATGTFKQLALKSGVEKLKKMYEESGIDFKTAFVAEKSRNDAKYWDTFLQSRASSFASIFA